MATAGSLVINIRKMFGDPNGDFITDDTAYDWLNRGQRRFCHKVLALDEIQDFTITSKQSRYDIATNCIIPIWLQWYQSRVTKLDYSPPNLWARIEEANPTATGIPEKYTIIRNQLIVGPQVPSTTSGTHLASGAMTAAATTMSVASTVTFRSKGFVKVDSEVMEYTSWATTVFSGLVRGVHGTTAATHASGATAYQVDMQMLYRKYPAVIAATSTVPDIPTAYHDYLEYYAVYVGWLARGDNQKAQMALEVFSAYERDAAKTIGRRSQDGLLQIQEKRNSGRWW